MNHCQHVRITVRTKTYPASRWEPAETIVIGYCDECGRRFDLNYDDAPEGSELRLDNGDAYELR